MTRQNSKNVWVFVELREGKIAPVVLELLGEGKKLAQGLEERLCAVVLSSGTDESIPEQLSQYGADVVYSVESPLLEHYTTDGYTAAMAELVRKEIPAILLFGATHIGRDLAPRLAARLTTGLTADCTSLSLDEETKDLMQTRPAFGGNLMATIRCPERRPQMATVRPGVMDKAVCDQMHGAEIIKVVPLLKAEDIRTEVLETVAKKLTEIPLTEARVIVSGGLGLGGPDGFDLLRRLADRLGGTVGSSRAAVDAGWMDPTRQVGQTGTTVKPDVYIACGISGAIQHLAGMKESKIIVAINTNPDAPIFEVADYGLVGDYREVIGSLLEKLGEKA